MYYQDEFQRGFSSQETMMDFLKAMETGASWQILPAKSLEVLALGEHPEFQEAIENAENEGILKDTQHHSRLLLKFEDQIYPVGDTAVKTLEGRARISGKALRLVETETLAMILNECLQVNDGKALLRIREGKVRATHSAQENQYKILPMPEIFQTAIEKLEEIYDTVLFKNGYYDQAVATAVWEIADEKLLKTYEELITRYEGSCPKLAAQIRVTTSDTADSGANIFYSLLAGPLKRNIALGSVIKLEHKGDNSIEKFGKNMESTFSRYQEATRNLERLMHIHIAYPVNVMDGVMHAAKLPKGLREKTVELFQNTNGMTPCSAYEVYCGICECLYLAESEGMGGYALAELEESVAKCLTMRYAAYDFPGFLRS